MELILSLSFGIYSTLLSLVRGGKLTSQIQKRKKLKNAWREMEVLEKVE